MPCLEWESRISVFVGRDQAGPESLAVSGHLQDCPSCRAYFKELGLLKKAARLSAGPPMPAELRDALRARAAASIRISEAALPRDRARSAVASMGGRRRLAWATGMAMAIAGAVAMVRIFSRDEPVPVDVLLAAHGRYSDSLKAAYDR